MVQKEKVKERARALYKERNEKGLCTGCGGERDRPTSKLCNVCLDKKNTPEKRQKLLEYNRNRKIKLVEKGLCIKCGKAPAMEGNKQCEVCNYKSQNHVRKKIEAGVCVTCGDSPTEPGRLRCRGCLDVLCEKVKRRNRDRKERVFEAYGGSVCSCCGETLELCLAIDHINNNGNEHRKQLKADGECYTDMTVFLEKNNYPDGFQILCQNCNWMKFRNGGECSHVKIRKQMELANTLYNLDGTHV